MKKKTLFLIHDLGIGGAEKTLVTLANHLDPERFDVTVEVLFGGGVNERFLAPHVRLRRAFPREFPANSKLMKLLTPRQLHSLCVRERYDLEVAFLEGPSARVVSGCPDPNAALAVWIHCQQHECRWAASHFRGYRESARCYGRFQSVVCVSEGVKEDFLSLYPQIRSATVRYNALETDRIAALAREDVEEGLFSPGEMRLCAVGKISRAKGFDRLARVLGRLRAEGLPVRLYILGEGPDRAAVQREADACGCGGALAFLGYQTNPYKYLSRCDLFVCASLSEGFSTAATEAIIVGTPVCTVDVAGMRELLGESRWGLIVPNEDEALYEGIRSLLTDSERLARYRALARERAAAFSTKAAVRAVEELLLSLPPQGRRE